VSTPNARQIFDRFDKDRSGSIEIRELDALLRSLGTTFDEDALLSAMASLKTAKPNRITWDEFQKMWSALQSPSKPAPRPKSSPAKEEKPRASKAQPIDLRAVFKTFDKDNSGYIDVAELASMMEAMGMEPDDDELDAAIEELDRDESGRISFDELRAWWERREL
jgi:calcium-binding protein CML